MSRNPSRRTVLKSGAALMGATALPGQVFAQAAAPDKLRFGYAITTSGPLGPGAGSCYPRSLLALRFLAAANARPRLRVGMRRRDGAIEGHAWVVVDGLAVGESAEELEGFTVLLELDPAES